MRESAVAVGGVALAVVCCAGAPVLIGALGLTFAAALGWGALLVVALVVGAIVITRHNRESDRR